MEENKDQKVEMDIKEVKMPKLDLEQYVGRKAKIESVDIYQGEFGLYVKMETSTIDVLKNQDKSEIKARRIFGLVTDDNNSVGWTKDGKLGLFLDKKKISEPKEMIGREVVIQIQTSKKGTEFLSFN